MWVHCVLELFVIKILPGNNSLPLSVLRSRNFELVLDNLSFITELVTAKMKLNNERPWKLYSQKTYLQTFKF